MKRYQAPLNDAFGHETPSILVATDDRNGVGPVLSAIESLNGRTIGIVPPEGLLNHMENMVAASTVVLQASRQETAERIGDLCKGISQLNGDSLSATVVIVTPDLIDPAYAGIGDRDIQLLADPDVVDILSALALAGDSYNAHLHDPAGQAGSTRLVQLSEEVGRIARALARLADAPSTNTVASSSPTIPQEAALFSGAHSARATSTASHLRQIIRARRTRDRFFRSGLFADPAWDMLLDLTAAKLDQKPVSVSSLCIAAAVPATTALRWIKSMTDEGLLTRVADNRDGRRIFIELSEKASIAMNAYLDWMKANALFAI